MRISPQLSWVQSVVVIGVPGTPACAVPVPKPPEPKPPEPKPEPVAANNSAMRAGAAIYKDSCAACHRDTGQGEINLFPRLAGSALVQSDDPTTLARVILHGTRAVSTAGAPTAPAMPAFDWRLDDAQVAAVLTYVRNSWGNAAVPVSAIAVTSQREALRKSP